LQKGGIIMDINKIFKIGVLVLGSLYLAYLFCPITDQAGRYTYHEEVDTISIFDTCTGLRYRCRNRDDLEGKVGVIDLIGVAKIEAKYQ
jgi:hypothetical protein